MAGAISLQLTLPNVVYLSLSRRLAMFTLGVCGYVTDWFACDVWLRLLVDDQT